VLTTNQSHTFAQPAVQTARSS